MIRTRVRVRTSKGQQEYHGGEEAMSLLLAVMQSIEVKKLKGGERPFSFFKDK
jgi:hypothetical protein